MTDTAYVRIEVMTHKEFKEYQRAHPNEKFDYYYQYDHRQRKIYSIYQYVTKKDAEQASFLYILPIDKPASMWYNSSGG